MELAQAGRLRRAREWVRSYFRDQDPDFWTALAPALLLCVALYVRSPVSNYIFDEQEALLANPYVNGSSEIPFWDAFKRDFWGLLPERSIGSYRPIPNLVWRSLWPLGSQPFLHHWVNVVVHAVNAALVASFALALTRRRGLSWLAGGCFLSSAVITEAVTGVVGIADVFGGLGLLLALHSLRMPLWAMPFGVFGSISFGLFSKESVLVAVPLVAWVALVGAPALHPDKPRRAARAALSFAATVLALVVYTELRRRLFPVSSAASLPAAAAAGDPAYQRALRAFLNWFRQPQLPHDPINNPLVEADLPHRIAGALRVYVRGLGQLVFPWTLSGDYSYPAEPVPARVVTPESVLGGLLLALPPVAGLAAWIRALILERRQGRTAAPGAHWASLLAAIGLVWIPLAYFPHSNILVLLPTVRAERFWYLPAIGAALLFAAFFVWLAERGRASLASTLAGIYFAVQMIQARAHALDYTNDLVFWRATRNAVPNSAKAHLNYSVMLGARGRLQERLAVNAEALKLAPRWPMAHVYYGDTLCRLHKPTEAWPHYQRGFLLAPNDPNLIALGLQCLWDQKAIEPRAEELLELAERHPGSWLAFLATDIVENGETYGGVQKKYRPRSYDEGPKK